VLGGSRAECPRWTLKNVKPFLSRAKLLLYESVSSRDGSRGGFPQTSNC